MLSREILAEAARQEQELGRPLTVSELGRIPEQLKAQRIAATPKVETPPVPENVVHIGQEAQKKLDRRRGRKKVRVALIGHSSMVYSGGKK